MKMTFPVLCIARSAYTVCACMDAGCMRTCEEKPPLMRGKPQGSFCQFESKICSSDGVKLEASLMLVHIVWEPFVTQVMEGI